MSTTPNVPRRLGAQSKEHIQKRVDAYKKACIERYNQRHDKEQELKRLREEYNTMCTNVGVLATILGEIHSKISEELERVTEMKSYITSVLELQMPNEDPFKFQETDKEIVVDAEECSDNDEPPSRKLRKH